MSVPHEDVPRHRTPFPTLGHLGHRLQGVGPRIFEYRAALAYVARWLVLVAPGAALIGSAVALFLWSLERATELRWAHPWLLRCLPLGGLAVGALYHFLGRAAEGGNNLIMDEIHEPGGGVPGRMAPLILVSTVLTHLFGGSAGREGTAVQMGGSIASALTRRFGLDSDDSSVLLTTGIAAGFGAVFGTPLTGAVFALEVLTIGRVSYRALVPCLFASLIGDFTVAAWGVHHTAYSIAPIVGGMAHVNVLLLAKVGVAAVAFGIVSVLFAELTHGISRVFKRTIRWPVARPFFGGVVLIALVLLIGTRDYLGLGVSSPDPHAITILSSFSAGGATLWSWWWKLLFTAVTLGAGFKGGEVTPLFFIGAALGNVLAFVMHAPVDLFAALGFVAVFAGATNTPLACTIMGIELFGADAAVYFATASFLSYLFSGHSGIYSSQRIATPKGDAVLPAEPELSLAELRAKRHAAQHPVPALPTTHPVSASLSHAHDTASVTHRHTLHHATPALPASHVRHHAPPASSALGQVRVYTTGQDKKRGQGMLGRFFPASVPHLIVGAAKKAGLPHAVILNTRFGYTGSGPIDSDHPEYGFTHLPICVELMGPPQALEQFCADHAEFLAGRMVVFRHAEAWELVHAPMEQDDVAASA